MRGPQLAVERRQPVEREDDEQRIRQRLRPGTQGRDVDAAQIAAEQPAQEGQAGNREPEHRRRVALPQPPGHRGDPLCAEKLQRARAPAASEHLHHTASQGRFEETAGRGAEPAGSEVGRLATPNQRFDRLPGAETDQGPRHLQEVCLVSGYRRRGARARLGGRTALAAAGQPLTVKVRAAGDSRISTVLPV